MLIIIKIYYEMNCKILASLKTWSDCCIKVKFLNYFNGKFINVKQQWGNSNLIKRWTKVSVLRMNNVAKKVIQV